jgi:nucleoside 2-deoxyribosyltransferase
MSQEMTDELFAFVLMPFSGEFRDIYQLGIKDPLEALNIRAERVDEQTFHEETILQRIYNQIEAADFVIADMTGRNPNVFYEVGYAHAKGKLCILLTASAEDIPFDLKHHRHIVYEPGSLRHLKERLTAECTILVDKLKERRKGLAVTITAGSGALEKSKYRATGEIDIYIDIINGTDRAFDVHSMYFYTGEGWKFSQDGASCASTKSDIPIFAQRHFVKPPLVKFAPRTGWARATIRGRKTLATTFKGEQLLETYHVAGTALLRLQTNVGVDEHQALLNVSFDEFPF